MRREASIVAALGIVIAGGATRVAAAAPEPEVRDVAPPCDGCRLAVPASDAPVPLIVVLHGDHETATKWFERWRDPALARGWGVLALQCPEKLGCDNAVWYRWSDGDAAWVIEQVEAVGKQVALDRDQLVVVGWSGGATFVGLHAGAFARTFAAIVIHGGGVPPHTSACPHDARPVYFLVGDGNELHPAARALRDYFERCGSEIEWDLLPGADHAHEDAALDDVKVRAILDWVEARTARW